MAVNNFLAFTGDGSEIKELKTKLAREVGDEVSAATKAAMRSTMGVPASAEGLTPSNNLSDVDSPATSRTNLDVMQTEDVNDRTNARQPSNGVDFNGSTSELEVAHNAALDFGETTDISIEAIIYHDGNATATRSISTTRGSGSSGHQFFIASDDRFHSYLSDGANSLSSLSDDPSGGDPLTAGWYHLVTTFDRDGNMVRYVNGVAYGAALSLSGASVGDVTNNNQLDIGNRNSGDEFKGIIAHYAIYNRLLSADEVARKAEDATIEVADQWGGAATYTSDFSAGVDGFTDVGVTSTGNYDSGDAGHADTLRIVAADGSSDRAEKSGLFTAGQRYRLALNHKMVVGSSGQITAGGVTLASSISAGSWTAVEYEFVAASSGSLLIYAANTGSASDEILVDGIVVTPIGAVAAYLPENIVASGTADDGDWVDSSSNALSATGTSVTPLRVKPGVSGSFTPTLTLGGTNAGLSFSTQQGNYRKLDDKTVHVEVNITTSGDTGVDTGDLIIGGLPFQAVNRSKANSFAVRMTGSAALTSAVIGEIEPASTQVKLYDYGATGAVRIADDNVGAATLIQFSATYEIA